jgi:predicted ribosome quality control (RQC) complex YloA/Tae2 family protein
VSPGGFEVLVGRSNRENDELSLRVASPGDVWLHARGVPGSHAVLRVPSSSSSASPSSSSSPASSEGLPPAEDLEFAAALAAFFSKARDGGKVAVTFTRARNVRKPRGAPAGLVTLMSEKVVSVRPDSVASVVAAATSGGASEVSGSESDGEVA